MNGPYKSWFFKRFKLTNLSFLIVDIYILIKGQGLNDTCIFGLINDYNVLFDDIHILKLYNFSQNG
jgi:hypothetical protein